jgi:hypothetical protein
MKKSIITLATLATLAASAFAMAAPSESIFRFECPNASGGTPSERLTNYGTYIRGMGEENVNGSKIALPEFKGKPSAGVPMDLALGLYNHAGTMYNASTGRITCLFVSSIGATPFNVSYQADNLKHGFVQKSDNSAITVKVTQG